MRGVDIIFNTSIIDIMISKYQKQKIEQSERRAFALYKTGMPLRDVGKAVGKSYEWVRQAVKKMEAEMDKVV